MWNGCATSSEKDWHALQTASDPEALLKEMTPDRLRGMTCWPFEARSDQMAPAGEWTTWLLLGGRGAGKTRAGAEWVRKIAARAAGPIAIVAETLADAREVMVEGVSGLLSIHPPSEKPRWSSSRRRLEWPNGAIALTFSSEDPESLRGPQFAAAWCDELAKWRHPQATWDMLQFGLRLGPRPRQVVTTTPRPLALLKSIMASPMTIQTRATTKMNEDNLAPSFLSAVVGRYAGTRLGRQELEAELIEERPDALWQRPVLEAARVDKAPDLVRIVIALDPPATSGARSDACGIIAAGLSADGLGYVLEDATASRLTPAGWASRAVAIYHRLAADRIVAEVNQGGEMVAAVIHQADSSVPVTMVRASRGKWLRAEPVAALYERGRVRHVGTLPELEDELCDFSLGGLSSGRSPDRLDALVWALSALMLTGGGDPKIRKV